MSQQRPGVSDSFRPGGYWQVWVACWVSSGVCAVHCRAVSAALKAELLEGDENIPVKKSQERLLVSLVCLLVAVRLGSQAPDPSCPSGTQGPTHLCEQGELRLGLRPLHSSLSEQHCSSRLKL